MSDIPDILTLYPVSRIEALERTARIDASIAKQLSHSMTINAKLKARIEALEAALRRTQSRIDYRLNEYLCEMKPGYDDSITGFNEAWDIVSKILNEETAHAALDKDAQIMSDDPETLIERLRNPLWVHSSVPVEGPCLAEKETVADLYEAADRIEALEAALREIEWHDPTSPAAAAVRAVLD
jgi:hypothetical protein